MCVVFVYFCFRKNTLILAGSCSKLTATFQLLWVNENDDFHAADSFLHDFYNCITITLWENTFTLNNDQSCETCTRLHICVESTRIDSNRVEKKNSFSEKNCLLIFIRGFKKKWNKKRFLHRMNFFNLLTDLIVRCLCFQLTKYMQTYCGNWLDMTQVMRPMI